jgi:hypothetical protein
VSSPWCKEKKGAKTTVVEIEGVGKIFPKGEKVKAQRESGQTVSL